ncbi:MAG: hypothetical protein QOE63_974 [Acidimicrobiaceae bacterium]
MRAAALLRPVHRRSRGDEGVTIVLFAFALVAILVMAAMAVDLGQLRASKRSDQSAADLAGLAAGFYLSGRGSNPVRSDAQAACAAAINSVQTDVSGFGVVLSTPLARSDACGNFPADAKTGCSSASNFDPVVVTSGRYTLTIRFPVPSGELADPRFNGVGIDDGTNQCERMRVTLSSSDQTTFARAIGISSLDTSATTVVRGNTKQNQQGVAALLLLERVGCSTLFTQGGGNSGGIAVEASSATNPGVIQSDSAGIVGQSLAGANACTTNSNESGYAIYGTALPSAAGGGPSIVAMDSSNGTEGIIGIYANQLGATSNIYRGGCCATAGINKPSSASNVNSRHFADVKYNQPVAQGGAAQISTLHGIGFAASTMTAATATTAGYTVLNGNAVCNGMDTTSNAAAASAAVKVFVDCPGGLQVDTAIFPNATDFVVNDKVSIANNKILDLPAARRIFIRGCTSGCSGGGNYALNVVGSFNVNTGASALPDGIGCASRKGPGAGGTTNRWTELATFGGPMVVTGQVRLCQTFVYLGRNSSAYAQESVTATGVSPENYPAIAGCSALLPCPKNGGNDSYIQFSGGSASADWSGPNQLSTQPTVADFATNPFEDLALWSETDSPSQIKGQGANSTEGVYFLPNTTGTFTGQATQALPLNAQFIARSLRVSSQGNLFLRPNLADAIVTPIPGGIELIR